MTAIIFEAGDRCPCGRKLPKILPKILRSVFWHVCQCNRSYVGTAEGKLSAKGIHGND